MTPAERKALRGLAQALKGSTNGWVVRAATDLFDALSAAPVEPREGVTTVTCDTAAKPHPLNWGGAACVNPVPFPPAAAPSPGPRAEEPTK